LFALNLSFFEILSEGCYTPNYQNFLPNEAAREALVVNSFSKGNVYKGVIQDGGKNTKGSPLGLTRPIIRDYGYAWF
jgi:hypothetical protein